MRTPTLEGHAKAWKLASVRDMTKAWDPAWEATIARYILHCTWSHPFWSYYFISGVHLRPIAGTPEAKKHFPSASHEIMIFSIDPKEPPDIDKVESGETFPAILQPADLVHQVSGLTDKQFEYLLQDVIVTIVEGRAAPDVDFRAYWQRSLDILAMKLRQGQVRVQ